MHFVEII